MLARTLQFLPPLALLLFVTSCTPTAVVEVDPGPTPALASSAPWEEVLYLGTEASADQIEDAATAAIDGINTRIDEITRMKGPRTVENTMVPINDMYLMLGNASSFLWTYSQVHPEQGMRDVCTRLSLDVDKIWNQLSLHRGIFEAMVEIPLEGLDEDDRRLIELGLADLRRNGIDRDEATRTRVAELKQRLSELSTQFSQNISNDVRSIRVSAEQLAGLPEDYVRSHPPDADGMVTITTAYPDFFPVLSYAEDGDVRKRIYHAFMNRGAPNNLTVLHDMLVTRQKLAQLLGHETWPDYSTSELMVGSGDNIASFIDKLEQISREPARAEFAEVLAEKQQDVPGATEIHAWEASYYWNRLKKRKYAYDSTATRPYFEFNRVKKGVLELSEELFEIRFERLALPVWHASVEAYAVFDTRENDALLGHFYLDLHPRTGKYGHAAHFTIRTGSKGKQLPVSLLVCNFPDPESPPALMSHGQAQTFFHEFGHLLHFIFSGHHRWSRYAGVAEWDFVEAPSQMLEEWIEDPTVLARFARHYETNEPIPGELIEKMERAGRFGRVSGVRRQAQLSAVSYQLHEQAAEGMDSTGIVRAIHEKFSLTPWMEDTYSHLSFGHLGGYNSNYYTYQWSLVIAKDMLSAFRKPDGSLDLMNTDIVRRYRERILEPGGSRPAATLVEDFLGRPYGFEAYREWLEEGIQSNEAP